MGKSERQSVRDRVASISLGMRKSRPKGLRGRGIPLEGPSISPSPIDGEPARVPPSEMVGEHVHLSPAAADSKLVQLSHFLALIVSAVALLVSIVTLTMSVLIWSNNRRPQPVATDEANRPILNTEGSLHYVWYPKTEDNAEGKGYVTIAFKNVGKRTAVITQTRFDLGMGGGEELNACKLEIVNDETAGKTAVLPGATAIYERHVTAAGCEDWPGINSIVVTFTYEDVNGASYNQSLMAREGNDGR